MNLLYIIFFGILGVLSRYYQGLYLTKLFPHPFPYATFFINLIGAFLIGVISVLSLEHSYIPHSLRLGIIIGFLGGYTTFSSYCLETVYLIENEKYFHAAIYFGLSPILGIIMTLCGIFLTRWLL